MYVIMYIYGKTQPNKIYNRYSETRTIQWIWILCHIKLSELIDSRYNFDKIGNFIGNHLYIHGYEDLI